MATNGRTESSSTRPGSAKKSIVSSNVVSGRPSASHIRGEVSVIGRFSSTFIWVNTTVPVSPEKVSTLPLEKPAQSLATTGLDGSPPCVTGPIGCSAGPQSAGNTTWPFTPRRILSISSDVPVELCPSRLGPAGVGLFGSLKI